MMLSNNMIKVFLLMLSLVSVSCISSNYYTLPEEDRYELPFGAWQLVQSHSTYEFNCPAMSKTIVKALGNLDFSARGCGKKAIYTCVNKTPWYLVGEQFECTRKSDIKPIGE